MITTQFMLGTLLALGCFTPCAVLAGLALYDQLRYNDGSRVLIALSLSAAACIALVWGAFAWPIDLGYHSYEAVTGTVISVDHDETTSLVHLDGDPRDLICVETRCALLAPGDRASLDCIHIWHIDEPDTWECLFVSRKATPT